MTPISSLQTLLPLIIHQMLRPCPGAKFLPHLKIKESKVPYPLQMILTDLPEDWIRLQSTYTTTNMIGDYRCPGQEEVLGGLIPQVMTPT